MSLVELDRIPSPSAVEVDDLVGLARILDSDVNTAIWRRPVDARIRELFEHAEAGGSDRRLPPNSRMVRTPSDPELAQHIARLLPPALHAADPAGSTAWADDVRLLCEAFADLVCADELLISLERADGATCPRFHVDRVGIRMLVTYLGVGTEWLDHADVDRSWLGHAGMDRPDEESGLMRPGATVHRAPTFAVVLLKGEAWPGADGFGAVHRSPDPGGQPRTLLRLDLLSQAPLPPATDDER